MKNIRNFCMIARSDHGKSTLADRLLELTHTVEQRDMEAQVLDNMDLERKKGITIKSHAIQLDYASGRKLRVEPAWILRDTWIFPMKCPGLSLPAKGRCLWWMPRRAYRSTISNLYLAISHNLEIIPVINKIDMDAAMVETVRDQVELLGCARKKSCVPSARTGEGV